MGMEERQMTEQPAVFVRMIMVVVVILTVIVGGRRIVVVVGVAGRVEHVVGLAVRDAGYAATPSCYMGMVMVVGHILLLRDDLLLSPYPSVKPRSTLLSGYGGMPAQATTSYCPSGSANAIHLGGSSGSALRDATAVSSRATGCIALCKEENDGATRHPVHRPVRRSPHGRTGAPGQELGLRRPGTGLLGRPFRGRQGPERLWLCQEQARYPGEARPGLLGHQQPPRRPVRGRSLHRRAAQRHPAGAPVGRRRPRGRAPSLRAGDDGHRARGQGFRRHAGQRLQRLTHLASVLFLPAQ